MQNRRLHPRFDFSRPAQIVHRDHVASYEVADLALGGLRVRAAGDLPVGEKVKVFLPLKRPTERLPRLGYFAGRVIWREDGSTGIAFEDLPVDARDQLAQSLHLPAGS